MSKDVVDLPPESVERNRRLEANEGFPGRGHIEPPEYAFETRLGASPFELKYGSKLVPYYKP